MSLIVSRSDVHFGFDHSFFARPKSRAPRKKFVQPCLCMWIMDEAGIEFFFSIKAGKPSSIWVMELSYAWDIFSKKLFEIAEAKGRTATMVHNTWYNTSCFNKIIYLYISLILISKNNKYDYIEIIYMVYNF